jgi:hypothetical protein
MIVFTGAATVADPEPVELSPHTHTLFLEDTFYYYPLTYTNVS